MKFVSIRHYWNINIRLHASKPKKVNQTYLWLFKEWLSKRSSVIFWGSLGITAFRVGPTGQRLSHEHSKSWLIISDWESECAKSLDRSASHPLGLSVDCLVGHTERLKVGTGWRIGDGLSWISLPISFLVHAVNQSNPNCCFWIWNKTSFRYKIES